MPTPPASGLQIWLVADDINQSDSTAIASWTDRASGFVFTAAGTAQPTYRTNQLNGHAGVSFNGTTNVLAGDAASKAVLNAKTGATVFIVNSDPGTNAGALQELIYIATPSALTARVRLSRDSTHARIGASRRLDADGITTITGAAVNTAAHIDALLVDFANTDLVYRADGTIVASNLAFSTTGSFSATNSTYVTLGAGDTAASEPWTGFQYEVLVYDRALSVSEIADVDTYLATKYALTTADAVTEDRGLMLWTPGFLLPWRQTTPGQAPLPWTWPTYYTDDPVSATSPLSLTDTAAGVRSGTPTQVATFDVTLTNQGQGSRAATPTQTLALGLTLTDLAAGARAGDPIQSFSLPTVTPLSLADVATGSRAGTPTQTFDATMPRSDVATGSRAGAPSPALALGLTVTDSARGARAADPTQALTLGLTVTDTAAGARAGDPAQTFSLPIITPLSLSDVPTGVRAGDPAQTFGQTLSLTDRPAGTRAAGPTQAFTFGLTFTDSPRALRAAAARESAVFGLILLDLAAGARAWPTTVTASLSTPTTPGQMYPRDAASATMRPATAGGPRMDPRTEGVAQTLPRPLATATMKGG